MIPPFVSVAWLEAHPDAVLVDSRWYPDGRSGHAAYVAGHIPGAVFADLDVDMSAPASAAEGRHPLPTPEGFAEALGFLGIREDDVVVAYDDSGGVFAARLVWMLRTLGQPAAVLDGGIGSYVGPLQSGESSRTEVTTAVRPWPREALATADDALSPGVTALDARTRERFAGAPSPLDPRPGHIPGAVSAPCGENLAGGRVKSPDDLAVRFAELGVSDAREVVAYCGSGVTACHNLLAMEHAGLGRGRLYPGSWSAYAADPTRPVTVAP